MTIDKPLATSGQEYRTFETGAQRDQATGKGAPELISPIFLKRLAIHLEKGAAKYEARNWEKGMPTGAIIASLFRHLLGVMEGLDDEDHEAAIACNIMFLIHTREMIRRNILPESLETIPSYLGNKKQDFKTLVLDFLSAQIENAKENKELVLANELIAIKQRISNYEQ